MELLQKNKKDLIFWGIIHLLIALNFFHYFYLTNKDLIPLAFAPLLSFAALIVGSVKSGKFKPYSTSLLEYLILVNSFFLLFLLGIILISNQFILIKILFFLIFSAIGWYLTTKILKHKRATNN